MQFERMYDLLLERGPVSETRETSPIYRSTLANGTFLTEFEGSRTIFELFEKSCEKFSSVALHGKRERFVDGSVGDFIWQSYEEVQNVVNEISKAIRLQGCKKGAKIGIYGANSPEWAQAMLACYYFDGICVPMYDSLGSNAVQYTIEHAEIEFIFVSESNCKKLRDTIHNMKSKASQIREICIWKDFGVPDDEMKSIVEDFKKVGIDVEDWVKLMHRGKQTTASVVENPSPPSDPENPALIMYTSGTTGVPKGVTISHRAIISTVSSAILVGRDMGLALDDGVHLSWLPLAHVYGFAMELACIASGSQIGFWQGKVDKLLNDISTLRPTHFLAVPRVWSIIMDAAVEKVNKRGALIKNVFDFGYEYKKGVLEEGYTWSFVNTILDQIIFSKIAQTLGGRLRFVGSGSAPLPKHVEEYLRVAFTVPLLQGYGLTETCGVTCASLPNRYDLFGTVGRVHPCAEFRLESVPELGYLVSNTPSAGELCFRGPCLFTEYHKNKEEYEKVVDSEGFFHTGDIVELQSTGALKIVDRKKNIFKLSQGEYVAVEMIESVLSQASSVGQIWVYGDSHQRYLVAIVYPNEHRLTHLVSESASLDQICGSEAVKKEVLKELTDVAKTNGLKGFERVRDIGLVSEAFTIENGMMTPSQKLKRHDLLRKYKTVIEGLYAEPSQH